jgi:Protein of unknown function (DUF2281)
MLCMTPVTTDRLVAKISNLPPDKQQSVLDFIEFLQGQPGQPVSTSEKITAPPVFNTNDFDDW